MNNKAKGWAIDPTTRTITAQVHTWDTAKAWVKCDLLECVRLDGGELWVDEEGMMGESKTVWVLNGHQMITGRAFLVGGEWTDHDGRGLPEVCWLRDAHQEPGLVVCWLEPVTSWPVLHLPTGAEEFTEIGSLRSGRVDPAGDDGVSRPDSVSQSGSGPLKPG